MSGNVERATRPEARRRIAEPARVPKATLQSMSLTTAVPRSSMRNPLQDQLLKAGLVKKGQVDQVAREQSKQRQGKAPTGPSREQVEAQRLQAERAERDRA